MKDKLLPYKDSLELQQALGSVNEKVTDLLYPKPDRDINTELDYRVTSKLMYISSVIAYAIMDIENISSLD